MNAEETAKLNQALAWKIVSDTNITEIWESLGAKINLVGSLKSGLLVKNRDIDFHIYTDELKLPASFTAMQKLAGNPAIERLEYWNLINTEEECIQWKAWYRDEQGEYWGLDIIHIRRGSAFDGMVEKVTDGIIRLLTPETRNAIIQIKFDTPDDIKIHGIEIYRAVLSFDIRTFDDFIVWRQTHPTEESFKWKPGD